ncbi:MAG: hypothetical protein JWM92_357 [Candidatus Nomurabacteria bacterium]|jgi:hypothetical protein|nr:hypothetical protein [Candidatus Nomurabacteria bacterium]
MKDYSKEKLSLWNARINPHTIAKKLEIELPYHPGKFNEIIYQPAILDISSDGLAGKSDQFSYPLYFLSGPESIAVDRRPVMDTQESDIIGHEDHVYNFSLFKDDLQPFFTDESKYLHVLIMENILYSYTIRTSIVLPIDQKNALGYPSDSPFLDEEGKSWMERLFLNTLNRRIVEIFNGKTFYEPRQIAKTA